MSRRARRVRITDAIAERLREQWRVSPGEPLPERLRDLVCQLQRRDRPRAADPEDKA